MVVEADSAEIPVGIDGEAVLMVTPVRCSTVPSALRVWLPKNRPGVPPAKPAVDWVRFAAAGRRIPGAHSVRVMAAGPVTGQSCP